MGMYTEIFLRAGLREDLPWEVKSILEGLVSGDRRMMPPELPDHPFFLTDRWDIIGVMGSAYFPRQPQSALTWGTTDRWEGSEIGVHANLKNYGGEIDKFFDWIDPYLDEVPGTFVGYSLYEESETPRLYHKQETR